MSAVTRHNRVDNPENQELGGLICHRCVTSTKSLSFLSLGLSVYDTVIMVIRVTGFKFSLSIVNYVTLGHPPSGAFHVL